VAANQAIFNAQINTQNPDAPTASAIAWSGDHIVAIGSDDQVREVCDGNTETVDAHGAAVTPGIVDGHQHLFHGAEFAQGLDLDRVSNLSDLRAAIAAERKRIGPGKWLMGFALEYSAIGGPYHHSLLDDAAGDGPMFLYTLDVHTGMVNAEAMKIANLTGPLRVADNSIVVVDENEKPTGELKEMAAMQVVLKHAPSATKADRMNWYAEAIRRQNAVGITEIHLMDGNLDTVDIMRGLEEQANLKLRILLHHFVYPYTSIEEVEAMMQTHNVKGLRWQADGVKFMLDGVIDTGTAWLEHPDSQGEGTEPMWPELSLYHQRARQFHDAGFRIATHAIGDRAVREVLDVYEGLPGGSNGRHRIEHIETSPDNTIARFKPLKVTASMQPVHMRWLEYDLSDPWSQRLDTTQCGHGWRTGDIMSTGALVVLGSDWPVAPFDPRMGMFAAQMRRAHDVSYDGPVGKTRALTGAETLTGYTRNAAIAVGADNERGMLAQGMKADLVMWQEDPSKVNPNDVIDLPVLRTVVGGETVYQA
jgi:predicted amidohydrolase YtcJ